MMVYEADPSWEGLQNMLPSFCMAHDGVAADTAAPINTSFDRCEGILQAGGLTTRQRVGFDFSAFQQQHEEAASTLATFSSAGGAAAAAAAVAVAQQAAAGGLGRVGVVVITTTSRSTYPVAAVVAGHALGSIQPQEEWQQQSRQQQRLTNARPRAPRPCLVVGPGQFGGKVGLLGALWPPELTKYLTPEEGGAHKPPRAPRTDLSHLTLKEKVDRHRELSRLHSHLKREQALLLEVGLEQEVTQMHTYQEAIDMAPFVMMVLFPDINNCRILFTNKTVTRTLGHEVGRLLGRSFVMMVHPQDQAHLASVLNECIFTSQPHHGRVLCRFWCIKGVGNNQQPFKQMDMTINIGTKGLICNLWEVHGGR